MAVKKKLRFVQVVSGVVVLLAGVTVMSSENSCSKFLSGAADDLFLEEVYGEKAIEWVKGQNARSLPQMQNDQRYSPLKNQLLQIMNSPDKLKSITVRKGVVYNFWRDEKNVRGVYRSTSLKSYLAGSPEWTTILDIDELAKAENENWVFHSFSIYQGRALVELSRGGKDAAVVREYDLATGRFVEGGFSLLEGKHSATWLDKDTLIVGLATDGEVTDSGYPRKIRLWKRGEPIAQAKVIFEGKQEDVSVSASVARDEVDGPAKHVEIGRAVDFFNSEKFMWRNNELIRADLPSDSETYIERDVLYVTIKSDWAFGSEKFVAGSLISFDLEKFITGKGVPTLLFTPSESTVLSGSFVANGRLFLGLSEHVNSKWVEVLRDAKGKLDYQVLRLPENSDINVSSVSEEDNLLVFEASNFLNPITRFTYDLKTNELKELERAPVRFDSSPYKVEQHFAVSKDGTRVPYYLVGRKEMDFDGTNPTLLNAYGGFEVNMSPFYSPNLGIGWLERGGVYVLANIRGGGEYGPRWHKAALKENRQRAYDDFHAVAEDLIARKVTNPEKLGIFGGSNGGLLMGVAVTQRPDLYKAAAIQVPLLDMLRYHKLLAGASWMGEYGDPEDPKMRPIISAYSPYQNVIADKKYPEVFFMTSTADDRVHPGHARRMAHKMLTQGHPFLYYENTEGGHGGSANFEQYARWYALQYVYFMQKLMD